MHAMWKTCNQTDKLLYANEWIKSQTYLSTEFVSPIDNTFSLTLSLSLSFLASGIFGVRHLQAFLLFLGLTLAYAMRVNLSVAIVAITDRHAANPEFDVRTYISLKLMFSVVVLWEL